MSDSEIPLIARAVPSSVRVSIPLEIIRKNEYRAGDKIAVRIEGDNGEAVEFTARVRRYGVQYMFTIPARIWPFIRDLGYDTNEVIPMDLTRPSP